MTLDLRFPIGWLLTIYGAILAVEGVRTGALVLGLNVNLYWGAFMLVCGVSTIYLAGRKRSDR